MGRAAWLARHLDAGADRGAACAAQGQRPWICCDCDFIPRSTTRVLVAKARELRKDGEDLHVVIPPREPDVWQTIELTELFNIYPWLTGDEFLDLTGRFGRRVP